jgi:hypothetical protein
MSSINPDDIRWNDEARAKILDDSDRVLREAVVDVASSHSTGSWEDAFAELNARLKDQFIDFEPGPDLRRYAEAIVAGEIDGDDGGSSANSDASASDSETGSDSSQSDADAGSSAASSDDAPTPATRAESSSAETVDATGGGSYADRPADQIAADAGGATPATPATDGSGDDTSGDAAESVQADADGSESSVDEGNANSDVTVTDEPSA